MLVTVGTHLVCKMTLFLYVKGIKREVPMEGEFICRVEAIELAMKHSGAPDYVYVDCTKSMKFLEGKHIMKTWHPLAGPNEKSGHNCHE